MNDLATIRRAYRYVVAYERRILDAFASIDEVVRDAGFVRNTPHRWHPVHRAFPSRDWPTERWAWDNVPLYAARFTWLAGEPNTAGTRYVLVDHVADTSFEEKRLEDRTEPDPLDGLLPAEAARSILRWGVVELARPVAPAFWRLGWGELLSKHLAVPVTQVFPTAPTAEPLRRERDGLRLTSWCLDLATVEEATTLDTGFLAPLREALSHTTYGKAM